MLDTLFRGKREDNGEWVYGYYVKLPSAAGSVCIMHVPAGNPDEHNEQYYVVPETVGQYIGVKDKNSNKIFEGDICHFYGGDYYGNSWDTSHFCVIEFCTECFWYLEKAEYIEIIGNVYDNPELIGGKDDAKIY